MNKKNSQLVDGIVVLVLVGTLLLLVNPMYIWMPTQMEMALVAVVGVLFVLFSALFWREKPTDEREEAHLHFSGRVAFFVGTAIATVGTMVQAVQHNLDPWLPTVLVGMVLAKYVARIYAERRR